MIDSSLSNNSWANIFANWVFPTPVCPIKIKEPIGRLGSFNPVRFRFIDFTILLIASSCPITLFFIVFSKRESLPISVCSILVIGTPLIIETTLAISSRVTSFLFLLASFSQIFFSRASCSISFFSLSLKEAASSYLKRDTASFFSCWTSFISSSIVSIFSGTFIWEICTLAPASSIASSALSGKNLSEIYLIVSFTQASIASGVYFTLWWFSYVDLTLFNISNVSS